MTVGYLIRRLVLMIPTLFGIMLVTFVITQFAPGGPIEHVLSRINAQGLGIDKGLQPSNDEYLR